VENLVESKNVQLSYFSGKKIFVTGHTGFKGSWLVAWLSQLRAQVKGYALEPEAHQILYREIEREIEIDSVLADICDRDRLKHELVAFQPDYVFHLAAQPLVRLSYEQAPETFQVNALGTTYLLEAIRHLSGPCSVVLITTDKVYQNQEWEYPYRETDPLGGYDPYSASKACAELIISSYRNSFFHPSAISAHQKVLASARAGNVIGGGDWAKDRIIPDIVRALRESKPVIVRNPGAVRPWQHVLEPLAGYLQLALRMSNAEKFGQAWNFGPPTEDVLSVEQLVLNAIKVWGRGDYQVPSLADQPHEANLLKLDISKTVSQLGWHPRWNAQQAIERTVKWYQAHNEGKSAWSLMTKNIEEYAQ